MRKLGFIIGILLLTSCSWTDIAKTAMNAVTGAADQGGINTDLQVGDKESKVDAGIGDTQKSSQSTGKINATTATVHQTTTKADTQTTFSGKVDKVEVKDGNTGWIIILTALAMAFFFLPSPKTLYNSLKTKYTTLRGKTNG